MWKYDLLKKVTVTVSLGDNFFTPSWLLFLPPSSSSSPSQFSSLGLSELSWFTRSTPSPLVTSLFSWGGFGLKEDTSLNKVKTTIFCKKFCSSPPKTSPIRSHLGPSIELRDDVDDGPGGGQGVGGRGADVHDGPCCRCRSSRAVACKVLQNYKSIIISQGVADWNTRKAVAQVFGRRLRLVLETWVKSPTICRRFLQ